MLLLLTRKDRCPRCLRDTVDRDLRRCLSCDARLLFPGDTAVWLHEQGLRSYYVWRKEDGWRHSTMLDADAKPNSRELDVKDPGPNYGKHKLPKGCSDQ